MLIEAFTFTEEILIAVLRKTQFDYRDESYQYQFFGFFGPSGFRCKEPNALLSNQVTLHEQKKSSINNMWRNINNLEKKER